MQNLLNIRSRVAFLVALFLSMIGLNFMPGSQVPIANAEGCLGTANALHLDENTIAEIGARNLRFGFLTNNQADDFNTTLIRGGSALARNIGIQLDVYSADFNANIQAEQFNRLLNEGVDGIFLTAVDTGSIGYAVVRANQADIPVFVVGGQPAVGEVISVMNASSYSGSFEAAAALMRKIGKKQARIAMLGIPFAIQTIRDRENGMRDAVTEAGGTIVASYSDFNEGRLTSFAAQIIRDNPDLDGIFATWSLAVNAAITAVAQADRNILIAGYDSEAPGYHALHSSNRQIVALSGQQAWLMGRAAIEGLTQHLLGADLCPEIITPNLLVTGANFEESWATQYPGIAPPWER